MKIFTIYLIFMNVCTFFIFRWDKRKARHHQFRISEFTLLSLAVLGGAFGAYVAMYYYRHKTKHLKFALGVPLIITLQIFSYIFFSGWL